jgi:hypothetical protein
MKRLLPWPDLIGELPSALLKNPKVKAWADDQRKNCIKPPPIPKVCYESQKWALEKLTLQALRLKRKEPGDARFGDTRIDTEQMLLSKAQAAGTANFRGLRLFMDTLWSNLPASESRLNRFLIRIGRALESKDARRPDWSKPDWLEVPKYEMLIVEGWCDRINGDGEHWPPLCCLTYGALAKFLTLCKVPPGQAQLWGKEMDTNLPKNPRTLERAVQRLGLVPIPKGRIRNVEKRQGQFRFA